MVGCGGGGVYYATVVVRNAKLVPTSTNNYWGVGGGMLYYATAVERNPKLVLTLI